MNRRKFFFSAAAASLAANLPKLARAAGTPAPAPAPTPAQVIATHAALFTLWFPLAELDIPADLLSEIAATTPRVELQMLEEFQNSALLPLLEAMTAPSLLPFAAALEASDDISIRALLAANGGFGAMPAHLRSGVFSFFFDGTASPLSMQYAMVLREAYLSGIWEMPLASPLCGIEPPKVFVNDPAKWARDYAPPMPPSRLRYNPVTRAVTHADGPVEYLVVGSGPAGSVVARQLQQAGKRVVLLERGPFVVWGSMDTRSFPRLMYRHDALTSASNSVVIRSGETVGGGTAVNIDLAFSPLLPNIQAHIDLWASEGRIDAAYYTRAKVAQAYRWVTSMVPNFHVTQAELNPDNLVLWEGALAYGAQPSRYRLNRYRPGASPSPVDDKHDAAVELLYPSLSDSINPLAIIPDALVSHIEFSGTTATGVTFHAGQGWSRHGNTLIDPAGLGIPAGGTAHVDAQNVILCAGTLGSSEILLRTALRTPAVDTPQIGKGLILHPSLPLIGLFDKKIEMLKGIDGGAYVDSYAVPHGFIIESMTGLPNYGALLLMGSGKQVYDNLRLFNHYAGYGVALIDTVSESNAITLDSNEQVVVNYEVSAADKARFRLGTAIGARMMFLAGARQVCIPSNENFLELPGFDPMVGAYLTQIGQVDKLEQNLQFVPNRTFLTAAHVQAANKIGTGPDSAVVSTTQRLWTVDGQEVPNAFVMDSSIFPTSVGANPMQTIYTFAKIFCDRLLAG